MLDIDFIKNASPEELRRLNNRLARKALVNIAVFVGVKVAIAVALQQLAKELLKNADKY